MACRTGRYALVSALRKTLPSVSAGCPWNLYPRRRYAPADTPV